MIPDCRADLKFFAGDGFCDDDVNIPSCNYDNGDCCNDPVISGDCQECYCYETEWKHQVLYMERKSSKFEPTTKSNHFEASMFELSLII